MGELKTIFEFELYGVGVDAGQTTFRLRHAWGELGDWGAGQTWSPFMDPDVFPNSIEYWGPSGMVFFRNVQLRWTPIQNENNIFMVALERPGASGDQGVYADRVELTDVRARFPAPDISAQYRMIRDWGHLQFSAIARWIEWDDLGFQPGDLSGDELGWGAHVSTNIKFGPGVFRGSVVYGEGIENYERRRRRHQIAPTRRSPPGPPASASSPGASPSTTPPGDPAGRARLATR
jgi:hypothetical protein